MIDSYTKKNIKNYINRYMPGACQVSRENMLSIMSFFNLVFICVDPFETKKLAKFVNVALEYDAIIDDSCGRWYFSRDFLRILDRGDLDDKLRNKNAGKAHQKNEG